MNKEGYRICITSQNLIEVWAVATRPVEQNGLGLNASQAERILLRVEASAFRLPDSDDVHAEWRRLVVLHGVCGKKAHDARLVAAMHVHRVTHILTFNVDDFARFPDVCRPRPGADLSA